MKVQLLAKNQLNQLSDRHAVTASRSMSLFTVVHISSQGR